jgi:pimeloyl-ACP methyl ester carboxylesterase
MTNPYLPPPGVRTELVEFDSGGRRVQGALFSPSANAAQSETAVILVHGVEQFWYVGPTMFLAASLAGRGYTTLGYNGCHSGQTFRWSRFESAVREVGDAIAFAKQRGFERIVLIGHSLGTPIIEYYAGDKPDAALSAIALYGPHINIPAVTRDSLLGPELYQSFLEECRQLVHEQRGREIRLLPYRKAALIITSAETFLSYRDVATNKAAVEPMIRRIQVPMLICYDPADNIHGLGIVTMRASIVDAIRNAAVSSKRVEIATVPSQPGNTPVQAHFFIGNEGVVTELTSVWLASVSRMNGHGRHAVSA